MDSKKILDTSTDEFKHWFGNSKAVYSNGNPIVVYHGTDTEFETLEVRDGFNLGMGIYVTPELALAKHYGNNIMKFYASIQKPFGHKSTVPLEEVTQIIDLLSDETKNRMIDGKPLPEFLMKFNYPKWFVKFIPDKEIKSILPMLGYDSYWLEWDEIVLFSPNQLKRIYDDSNTQLTESKSSNDFIDTLCKQTTTKLWSFSGNCGMFALALATYLQYEHINSSIVYCTNNEVDENDLMYGDYDLYHVAVKIENDYYDGSGKINVKDLINFCIKEYDNEPYIIAFDFDVRDKFFKNTIQYNTDWDNNYKEFLSVIEKIAGKLNKNGGNNYG